MNNPSTDAKGDIIEEAQKKYEEKVTKATEEMTQQALSNVTEKKMLPKDAIGLDEKMMEGVYSYGYRLYTAQSYRDALAIFRLLMLLNPTEKKYLFSVAATLHQLHEYQNAVVAYLLAALFDPSNPVIYFHLADCYAHVELLPMAQETLQKAVELSTDKPQYEILRQRSLLMIESMKNGTFTLSNEEPVKGKWGQDEDDEDED